MFQFFLGESNFQMASKLLHWVKSYGNFGEREDFTQGWSCIRKVLRLQPAQQACYYLNCTTALHWVALPYQSKFKKKKSYHFACESLAKKKYLQIQLLTNTTLFRPPIARYNTKKKSYGKIIVSFSFFKQIFLLVTKN